MRTVRILTLGLLARILWRAGLTSLGDQLDARAERLDNQ